MVVSIIFLFSSHKSGKWSNLTSIFFKWVVSTSISPIYASMGWFLWLDRRVNTVPWDLIFPRWFERYFWILFGERIHFDYIIFQWSPFKYENEFQSYIVCTSTGLKLHFQKWMAFQNMVGRYQFWHGQISCGPILNLWLTTVSFFDGILLDVQLLNCFSGNQFNLSKGSPLDPQKSQSTPLMTPETML